MNTEVTNTKPNYAIHCIYAGAFLLAIFFFVSYLIWNRIQINNEIKAKDEERRLHNATQIEQKAKISACLGAALNIRSRDWADACLSENQRLIAAYKNCLRDSRAGSENNRRLYVYKISECKSLYQYTSLVNANCTLPKSLADRLNNDLNRLERNCRENT